jgi:hypothetical protein
MATRVLMPERLLTIEQAQSPHHKTTKKGTKERKSYQNKASSQICKTRRTNSATAVAFTWLTNQCKSSDFLPDVSEQVGKVLLQLSSTLKLIS